MENRPKTLGYAIFAGNDPTNQCLLLISIRRCFIHTLWKHTQPGFYLDHYYSYIFGSFINHEGWERKLCIWFEKKYYFWNEVSLRLKAFKIKWSIEQHFRQFPASKYLLQIYNLPLFKMMKIELFICPLWIGKLDTNIPLFIVSCFCSTNLSE